MSGDNSIPNGWVETTLGEVSKRKQYGYTESANLEEIGPKFLRITDIQNDFINWQTVPYCPISDSDLEKYKLNVGDVVIARTGNSTGATMTIKEKVNAVFASYLIRFQLDINKADYNFIDFLVRSKIWYSFVKSVKSGSAQGGANANDFALFPINLPPLSEQKAIAKILTAFDDKIELLQAQNKTLETTAQTLFKEWFGKESDNWELIKISEFVEISSSKRIFHNEYVDNGIPFYRSKEIIELSTKPDISTELFISKERFNKIKNKFDVPIKGDILLTAVGTIGVSFQVRDNNPFYFKDGNLIWFKNFNEQLTSDFLYNWLKLKSTQYQLGIISIGSTQKALTIASVKELEIPFIKNSIKRREFNDLLKSSLNKVNHNQFKIQTLKQTRDTLLPKLMIGQLRVDEFKEGSLC